MMLWLLLRLPLLQLGREFTIALQLLLGGCLSSLAHDSALHADSIKSASLVIVGFTSDGPDELACSILQLV